METVKKWWLVNKWRFVPYLHLYVDIGIASLRTCIMYQRFETQEMEWVALELKFLSWSFQFRLYTTKRRTFSW